MALVSITAVALVGGVMFADPADAGKKRKKYKKAKVTKVVQVSKGGDAKGGDGGAGGKGGNSGNVANTGNVTGGPFAGPIFLPIDAACVATALETLAGPLLNGPPGPGTVRVTIDPCIPGPPGFIPEELTACLSDAFDVVVDVIVAPTPDEIAFCLGAFPGGILVPGPRSGVFSGDGGAGGAGAAGGAAFAGSGGDNTNTSTHTVTVINSNNDNSIKGVG
jgi:hypothetical protein